MDRPIGENRLQVVSSEAYLKVAVCICAFNEARNIGRLLENLLEYGPNQLNKIFVVASGCTDNTVSIAMEYAIKDPRIKLIVESRRNGKPRAINLILKTAQEDVLFLLDADILLSPNCLIQIVSFFSDPSVGCVSCKSVPVNDLSSFYGFSSWFIWSLHHLVNLVEQKNGCYFHPTRLVAIRNGLVREIPEFIINDDAYLGMMIRSLGYKVVYNPETEVYFKGPSSIREIVRQRIRWIAGHRQLLRSFGKNPMTNDLLFVLRVALQDGMAARLVFRNFMQFLKLLVLEVITRIGVFLNRESSSSIKRLWIPIQSTKCLFYEDDVERS